MDATQVRSVVWLVGILATIGCGLFAVQFQWQTGDLHTEVAWPGALSTSTPVSFPVSVRDDDGSAVHGASVQLRYGVSSSRSEEQLADSFASLPIIETKVTGDNGQAWFTVPPTATILGQNSYPDRHDANITLLLRTEDAFTKDGEVWTSNTTSIRSSPNPSNLHLAAAAWNLPTLELGYDAFDVTHKPTVDVQLVPADGWSRFKPDSAASAILIAQNRQGRPLTQAKVAITPPTSTEKAPIVLETNANGRAKVHLGWLLDPTQGHSRFWRAQVSKNGTVHDPQFVPLAVAKDSASIFKITSPTPNPGDILKFELQLPGAKSDDHIGQTVPVSLVSNGIPVKWTTVHRRNSRAFYETPEGSVDVPSNVGGLAYLVAFDKYERPVGWTAVWIPIGINAPDSERLNPAASSARLNLLAGPPRLSPALNSPGESLGYNFHEHLAPPENVYGILISGFFLLSLLLYVNSVVFRELKDEYLKPRLLWSVAVACLSVIAGLHWLNPHLVTRLGLIQDASFLVWCTILLPVIPVWLVDPNEDNFRYRRWVAAFILLIAFGFLLQDLFDRLPRSILHYELIGSVTVFLIVVATISVVLNALAWTIVFLNNQRYHAALYLFTTALISLGLITSVVDSQISSDELPWDPPDDYSTSSPAHSLDREVLLRPQDR